MGKMPFSEKTGFLDLPECKMHLFDFLPAFQISSQMKIYLFEYYFRFEFSVKFHARKNLLLSSNIFIKNIFE
jgi:hypothetical protein